MQNFEFSDPEIIVAWGCNPGYQYERDWLLNLLRPCWVKEVNWFQEGTVESFKMHPKALVILIESARHLLNSEISRSELEVHQQNRLQRINQVKLIKNLIIWHISDEEGIDGDYLYPKISNDITIFRSFPHKRFSSYKNIHSLPLGPSRWSLRNIPWINSTKRKYSWCFMGTMWPNTSREQAVNCFRENVFGGFFYKGSDFSSGLPVSDYIETLLQSTFSICPEGNRHFETFRFYESLELGSIPLSIVDKDNFHSIFKDGLPFPSFKDWEEAAEFANELLKDPIRLNNLQLGIRTWWLEEKHNLSARFQSLIGSELKI